MWIVGDNNRFISATDWLPKTGLEDGIRLMINAYS